MKAKNIIPVADEKLLKENGVFFSPKTLRKWHCIGKHPQIFIKLNRRLFVDLDEWTKVVELAKLEAEKRTKKTQKFFDAF